MTNKQYRTHQGRLLDIGSLVLKNERTRAVGNMSVNARGDRVDADNRPIDSKPQQVNRQYRRQVSNVQDTPVMPRPTAATPSVPPVSQASEPAPRKSTPAQVPPPVETDPTVLQGGLAAAIAKAQKNNNQ